MANVEPLLSDVMIDGAELPANVFVRPFARYFFFDADVTSSEEMISAVRYVVLSCFDPDIEVELFASSNRNFLAYVRHAMDWPREIRRVAMGMRKAGDVGGLALVDSKRRWILYQSRPVDIGLFAIDCRTDPSVIVRNTEAFFDCSQIRAWLDGRTPRDIDLVNAFGAGFLSTLIKSYC